MKQTGENRRDQIIEVATQLFSREGYKEVTTKELARRCGVSEPALYRYYPSKEAIYDAVLDAIGERLAADEFFAAHQADDDIELLLQATALQILGAAKRHKEGYRLLLYAALQGHDRARQVFHAVRGEYVKFLNRQLDRLFQNGAIVRKNNEITARCFVGMVFDCALGSILWRGFQGRAYKSQEVIANNVPIYARGLRSDTNGKELAQS